MKLIIISLTLIASALLFIFCKHQPKFTRDNLPAKQLRWGSGGGFAGKETTHILLENGQIFQQEMNGPATETGSAKPKTAATLFKTVESLALQKLEFNHPGNIYSFLELQQGDSVAKVVWGDQNFTVNDQVKALYDQLNALLKK